MKRSGRTIIKMTLGLVIFTTFIGWYDGRELDSAELENLDSSGLPNIVKSSGERIRQAGDTGPVYLVLEKGALSAALVDWRSASIPDPVVKTQVKKALSSSFPEKGFTVIRFRNLLTFSNAMISARDLSVGPLDGILFSSQHFVLNVKGVIAVILMAAMLTVIIKIDKQGKKKPA